MCEKTADAIQIGVSIMLISVLISFMCLILKCTQDYLASSEETFVEEVERIQESEAVVKDTPKPIVTTFETEQQIKEETTVDNEYANTILVVHEHKVPFTTIFIVILCIILIFYICYIKRATQREKHTQEILSIDLGTFQKEEIEELKKKYK